MRLTGGHLVPPMKEDDMQSKALTFHAAAFAVATLLASAASAHLAVPASDLAVRPAAVASGHVHPMLILAKHGADDPKGHTRGGGNGGKGRGGHDDGPNHT
jgi:poly(3-hydroxybutyrate) depolymerase